MVASLEGTYGDLPPDPSGLIPVQDLIDGRVVSTTTSLIFKNFKSPRPVPIEERRLFDVARKGEYEVVKAVINAKGDGEAIPYSFEWRSGRVFLRINHKIDDKMTYVAFPPSTQYSSSLWPGHAKT